MNLKYGDYVAKVELDEEAGVMFGRVLNMSRDGISFEGESIEELTQSFHDAVDSYLDACEAEGVSPEKPYSGVTNLRMGPDLHKHLARLAVLKGLSLNETIVGLLRESAAELEDNLGIDGNSGRESEKNTEELAH